MYLCVFSVCFVCDFCVCNSVLAGLVSITAGCATVTTWAAFLCGIVGAIAYLGASRALLRFGIDDPLDASTCCR